jgi:hypothetical protein
MLLKYSDYISEKVVNDMLLESRVVYSNSFLNLLNKMDNKVAKELVKLYSNDVNVQHNYIDITDDKEAVSFTPDRRVIEITGGDPDKWIISGNRKQLTHVPVNKKVFEALGYDDTQEYWQPANGSIGYVMAEVTRKSGKVYVLFKDTNSDRTAVLNKSCISLDLTPDERVWTTARNSIRVGRLARAILQAANVAFVDRDIEDFTNQYKAIYDFEKDALARFDIVQGDQIAHWYNYRRYEGGDEASGTLNNSCMAHKPASYFQIYTANSNCSLIILYDDHGRLGDDGKYTSTKIKGRALLWKCKIGDRDNVYYVDRIYTRRDSDVQLFKRFAESKGYYYTHGGSRTNGTETLRGTIVVDLDVANCGRYPYMDSLCYVNIVDKTCSSRVNGECRVCQDTDGSYWTERA